MNQQPKYLEDYIIACCNLYGMIHENRISKLYKLHHPGEAITFGYIDENYLNANYIHHHFEFFFAEAIYLNHEMSKHLEETNYKPYYIPKLTELLTYRHDGLNISHPSKQVLIDFMIKQKNETIAYKIIDDITGLSQVGAKLEGILNQIKRYGIDDSIIRKIIPWIIDIANHTRTWLNNGYTAYEMVEMHQNKNKIGRNEPCPCGSGKKYKYCCKDKTFIGEGNQELYYEDVFKMTEKQKDELKMKLLRENDRIIFYTIQLKNPSMRELIDDLLSKDVEQYRYYEPKLIMGALAILLYELNEITLGDAIYEKILRSLFVWTRRIQVDYIYNELVQLIDGLDLPNDDTIMLNLFNLYKEFNYTPVYEVQKQKPYAFLIKLQEKTFFDAALDERIETLAMNIYRSKLKYIPEHLYNMLHIYPLSVPTLRLLMDFVNVEEHVPILKATIYAFEKSRISMLENPSDDFYHISDNRIYIMSLDTLAYIYKQQRNYKSALPLYQKILKYDLGDHFTAKESVLICYLYSGMIDEYLLTLDTLSKDSPYRLLLELYALMEANEPYLHQYLDAKEHCTSILDIICNDYDPFDSEISQIDRLFLDDFYELFSGNKKVMSKLIDVHVRNHIQSLNDE